MNFVEALKIMENGGLVRLKCWAKWIAVTVIEGLIYDTSLREINFSVHEMLSNDWEECTTDANIIEHIKLLNGKNPSILKEFKKRVVITISFEEAFRKLKEGCAIKNLEWQDNYWIFKYNDTIFNTLNEPVYTFYPEQMLDNNWIVKENKFMDYMVWNSNTRYPRGTIVTYRDKLYCSICEVKPGVFIGNNGYWKLVSGK